jgi:ribosome-associated protein
MRSLQSIKAERAKAELDDRDPRSRSDARNERIAASDRLMALGERLCALPEKQFKKLELSDAVRDVVADARLIDSPPARARQMKLVRKELRDGDADGIERKLEELLNPLAHAPKEAKIDPVWELYERLQLGGDVAIHAFCAEQPDIDVPQLRMLLRAAAKQRGAQPEVVAAKLPAVRKVMDRLRKYA